MFLSKVKTTSNYKYKTSFNNFYEALLARFEYDDECVRVMAKVFSQSPFNVSFMTFLISDYGKKHSIFEKHIGHDLSFKSYDVFRIGLSQRIVSELKATVEAS